MADPSTSAAADKAVSQLEQIQKKIKSEGFSSIEELIESHQKVSADLTKAEEARDKFSEANDEAQKIIRSKGGEIGTLKEGDS